MRSKKKEGAEKALPELTEGQTLSVSAAIVKEGKSSPPQHFTEDTLLSAMETAGKEDMPEDAERKGLGTPATRAGILEKLVSAGFLERKKSRKTVQLLPSHDAVSLITVLPEQLQSPLLTAEWEYRLGEIERGQLAPEEFLDGISTMLKDLVGTYQVIKGTEYLFTPPREVVGKCPRCGGEVAELQNGFFCQNKDCKFAIWKNNKWWAAKKKQPTKAVVSALLNDGRVRVTGLYSEKTGKTYVTSRYTMDAKDSTVRRYLAQRAELLGAIRLPNDAFKKNAGAEVVSDIIFLQKRDRPLDIAPEWTQTGIIRVPAKSQDFVGEGGATEQELNMTHFDCWASRFGETVTALELAPEGTGYRARTRFSKFFNLPELMNLFKEVADIKTADQLNLPTPEVEYHNVVAQPTEHQQEMVKALSERASLVHSGTVDPSQDNMLKITSDGRKLGLDQRIVNQMLPDEPGTKVNQCVENIMQIWRDGEADKLTQLVFCDISTPQAKAPASKAAKTLDNPLLHALEGAVPLPEQEPAFTVYDDIRQKLIAQGMPADQIAFIHEANTEVRKKELFSKVRTGQVRVLMGSTAKMGAGTNVQDRLVALHDLDCPWRPGDLAQRKGRIERQGNQNPLVHVYRYVTEGTFDAYLWVRHEVA